jgi:hypothetical protein
LGYRIFAYPESVQANLVHRGLIGAALPSRINAAHFEASTFHPDKFHTCLWFNPNRPEESGTNSSFPAQSRKGKYLSSGFCPTSIAAIIMAPKIMAINVSWILITSINPPQNDTMQRSKGVYADFSRHVNPSVQIL